MARPVISRTSLDLLTTKECKSYALSSTSYTLAKLMHDFQVMSDTHEILMSQEEQTLIEAGRQKEVAQVRESAVKRLDTLIRMHGELIKQQALLRRYLADTDDLAYAMEILKQHNLMVIPSVAYEPYKAEIDELASEFWAQFQNLAIAA